MIRPLSTTQRGITLLEVMVSVGILGSVIAGVYALKVQQTDDIQADVVALHMKAVGDAANTYIKDNYAAVAGLATPTTPVLITVPMLTSSGYLNAGFNPKNLRGQDTCVLVLEPTANNLMAMVVTEGGDTIDDLTLGQVAATIGAAGGGIYSSAATTFRGVMGNWNVPAGNFVNGAKCDGSAGVINLAAGHPAMALWFADGVSSSPTLYRASANEGPSLNTMNTPIILGAGTVQITDPLNAASNCTTAGALGRDADGKVVSCVDGKWTAAGGGSAYWGDPVDQAAAMPACSASNANETRVRFGYADAPTRRLFTCNGTGWVAVGVDHVGDFSVPGTLTASGAARFDGAAETHTTLTTVGQMDMRGGAIVGTGQAANPTNSIVLNTTAIEGEVCTSPGMLARLNHLSIHPSSMNAVVVCQEGVWRRVTVASPRPVTTGTSCTTFGVGALGVTFNGEIVHCKYNSPTQAFWRRAQSANYANILMALTANEYTASSGNCSANTMYGGGGECVGGAGFTRSRPALINHATLGPMIVWQSRCHAPRIRSAYVCGSSGNN